MSWSFSMTVSSNHVPASTCAPPSSECLQPEDYTGMTSMKGHEARAPTAYPMPKPTQKRKPHVVLLHGTACNNDVLATQLRALVPEWSEVDVTYIQVRIPSISSIPSISLISVYLKPLLSLPPILPTSGLAGHDADASPVHAAALQIRGLATRSRSSAPCSFSCLPPVPCFRAL